MSEENIEAKQQFLRSQIIDQGYNPDDFSTFMGTIKGEEGLNIESWSLEDLKLVVNQYKLKISELQGQQEQLLRAHNFFIGRCQARIWNHRRSAILSRRRGRIHRRTNHRRRF